MNKFLSFLVTSTFLFISCSKESTIASFKTPVFKLSIDSKGLINEFTDLATGKNYLSNDSISPLLALRIEGRWEFSESVKFIDKQLELKFKNDQTAVVGVIEKDTHIQFELISLTNKDNVDLIQWGPYRTTIQKIIGETVGVVR